MRVHIEAFDALAQRRIEDITNNCGNGNQTLLNLLKELRRYPSHQVIQQILSLKKCCDFFLMFVTGNGHRFQMTMQYLKDASLMLTIVSAVREGVIGKHLQAERNA